MMVGDDAQALLTVDGVRFGFPGRPDFLGPIVLAVRPGEFWSIVGPNGAGKSTLLRLMAGLYRPRAGSVRLDGSVITDMPARQRARCVAFLPQHAPTDLDLPAREVVLMGRFPQRSLGLFESAGDYRIADEAMTSTETLEFADRPIDTLSGGEAQRVHLAAALAQEPQLLMLDEPTASLDLQHQLAIFEILRDRASRERLGVVVVTHDINLAARFGTRVLLLDQGRAVAVGPPRDVLIPDVLAGVYGVEMTTLSRPGDPDHRWVVPLQRIGRGSA